eukprot:12904888-Prorocentrum_lima.AAC.1
MQELEATPPEKKVGKARHQAALRNHHGAAGRHQHRPGGDQVPEPVSPAREGVGHRPHQGQQGPRLQRPCHRRH